MQSWITDVHAIKDVYTNSHKMMLWRLWDYCMATTTKVKQTFILKSLVTIW